MSDMYDKEGKRISIDQWSKLHADLDYRVIGSEAHGPYHVSTVWLGMDHSWGGSELILFETLVFADYRDGAEIDGQRYTSEDEAKLGHQGFVATYIQRQKLIEEVCSCPVQLCPKTPGS